LGIFAAQLSLNVGWSALFFGLRQPGLAFAEILVLWTAIAGTTLRFWRVSRLAGLLLVPYLLWVTFASALNYAVWRKNP
jgi:tryptophan-rich sensory protein